MDENKVIDNDGMYTGDFKVLTPEEAESVSGGLDLSQAPDKVCPHCWHYDKVSVKMEPIAKWESISYVTNTYMWGYQYRCPRCSGYAQFYIGQ